MTVKQFLKPFIPPTALFIFHVFADIVFHVYSIFPAFDIPMHFFGGVTIALMTFSFYRIFESHGLVQVHTWILVFLITCVVSLAATVWEFAEFTGDYFFQTQMQAGLPDTMLDMFLGVLGGLLTAGSLVFGRQKVSFRPVQLKGSMEE